MYNSKPSGNGTPYDSSSGFPPGSSSNFGPPSSTNAAPTPLHLYQQQKQQLAMQSQVASNGLYSNQGSNGSPYLSQPGASMYGQQQPQQQPQSSPFPTTSNPQYLYNNAQSLPPSSPYGASSSTSNLFQQQLAIQVANQPPAPTPSSRPNQQAQMLAAMQLRQQVNVAAQQPRYDTFQNQGLHQNQSPLTSSVPPPQHSMYSVSQPPTALAASVAPTPPPTGPNSLHQAQLQERFNAENPISGLTAEKFNALQPHQQLALRQYIAKQRALPQAQVGLGFPSAPSLSTPASSTSSSPTLNGASPGMGGPGNAGMGVGGSGIGNGLYSNSMYQRPTSQGPLGMANQPPMQLNQQQQQLQQHALQAMQMQATSNAFLKTLSDFYAQRGSNFPGPPAIEGRVLDLAKLYARELALQFGHQGVSKQ